MLRFERGALNTSIGTRMDRDVGATSRHREAERGVIAGAAASGLVRADLDRRGFLRSAAGGATAVALASALPAGCAADYPQAQRDGVSLRAFSPKEYAVARAAAECMLRDVPARPAAVAAAIDSELALAGDPVRTDMKTVLRLVEHLTFLGGGARRFTALDPDRRLAYLDGWSRSRFNLRRGAYQALRGFVSYFAFVGDDTRALTGFPGPWPERLTIPATPVDFGAVS